MPAGSVHGDVAAQAVSVIARHLRARAGRFQHRAGSEPLSAPRACGRAGRVPLPAPAGPQAGGRRLVRRAAGRGAGAGAGNPVPIDMAERRLACRRREDGRDQENVLPGVRRRGILDLRSGSVPPRPGRAAGRRLCRRGAGSRTAVVQPRPGRGLGPGGPGLPGGGSLPAPAVAGPAHGPLVSGELAAWTARRCRFTSARAKPGPGTAHPRLIVFQASAVLPSARARPGRFVLGSAPGQPGIPYQGRADV